MTFLLDPEFWARLSVIILIDLSLAGDNALVIALAVRSLPAREQFLGRIWGTAGAVMLRILFVTVVSTLLRVPLLQLAGGLILVWIAVRLVRPGAGEAEHVRKGASLREAVWIIVVADVTMSLDNVLAVAAAAHGDLRLVVFGILLSIPLVVWGSGLLSRLMGRYPWIVWVGGGVLGYVAGEMMMDDPLLQRWHDIVDDPTPILLGLGITALGWWLGRGARPDKPLSEGV
jgi:YjbE family integral membrane protein